MGGELVYDKEAEFYVKEEVGNVLGEEALDTRLAPEELDSFGEAFFCSDVKERGRPVFARADDVGLVLDKGEWERADLFDFVANEALA